jgi:5-methylcytosine-specific restriction endonuclease McrA
MAEMTIAFRYIRFSERRNMKRKYCSMCKKRLPIDRFSKHKTSKDGIRSYCKACAKSYKDKWDKENASHRAEYKLKYNTQHREEAKAYSKQYRIDHHEECLQKNRERKRRNKDKIKVVQKKYAAEYYEKNKDYVKSKVKAYQENNREKTKVYKMKNRLFRREAMLKSELKFTPVDWLNCLNSFNNECAYCGSIGNLTQEHVVPIIKGGTHDPCNIVPACNSCNTSKNSKDLEEWYHKQIFFTQERLNKIKAYISKG